MKKAGEITGQCGWDKSREQPLQILQMVKSRMVERGQSPVRGRVSQIAPIHTMTASKGKLSNVQLVATQRNLLLGRRPVAFTALNTTDLTNQTLYVSGTLRRFIRSYVRIYLYLTCAEHEHLSGQ